MNKRHVDDGVGILQFQYADQYVCCPDCQLAGVLFYKRILDDPSNQLKAQYVFTCQRCNRHLDNLNPEFNLQFNGFHKIDFRENCHYCGGTQLHIYQIIQNIKHPLKDIEKSCPRCKKISRLSVRSEHINYQEPSRLSHTQFGLKLYLVAETRLGNIYVHNPAHLDELKSFVQASLRERTQNTGNSSYYARLPAWIKSARNRKEILKAILRLEQMASTIQPSTKK